MPEDESVERCAHLLAMTRPAFALPAFPPAALEYDAAIRRNATSCGSLQVTRDESFGAIRAVPAHGEADAVFCSRRGGRRLTSCCRWSSRNRSDAPVGGP